MALFQVRGSALVVYSLSEMLAGTSLGAMIGTLAAFEDNISSKKSRIRTAYD